MFLMYSELKIKRFRKQCLQFLSNQHELWLLLLSPTTDVLLKLEEVGASGCWPPNCRKHVGYAACAWRGGMCGRDWMCRSEEMKPRHQEEARAERASLVPPFFLLCISWASPLAVTMPCVAAPSKCQPGVMGNIGQCKNLVKARADKGQFRPVFSPSPPSYFIRAPLTPHNNHGLRSYSKKRQPLFSEQQAQTGEWGIG